MLTVIAGIILTAFAYGYDNLSNRVVVLERQAISIEADKIIENKATEVNHVL